jgi:formiminoglutamase
MNELNYLKIYNKIFIENCVRRRQNETKLGEKVNTLDDCASLDELKTSIAKCPSEFVLLGLPEDVGVRANYGRGGAYSAWMPSLENLLNIQSNRFLSGKELLVLGHVIFDDLMYESTKYVTKNKPDIDALRNLTSEIDSRITPIINAIAQANKTLILIGGGHNNSYPIIKGISTANNEKLNIINIDPHSDFRNLEGRHSGNGFSYAFEEKFISKYSIVGLHESYNSETIINTFNNNPSLNYYTYEDIAIREKIGFDEVIELSIKNSYGQLNGLEIDLDAIQNIPSSAKTSSGFLPVDIRKFISKYASVAKPKYIHIAEGAPVLSHIKTDNKTGKLIAYFVSDFMKAMKNND